MNLSLSHCDTLYSRDSACLYLLSSNKSCLYRFIAFIRLSHSTWLLRILCLVEEEIQDQVESKVENQIDGKILEEIEDNV